MTKMVFTEEDLFEDLSQSVSFIMGHYKAEHAFNEFLTNYLRNIWVVFGSDEYSFKLPLPEVWEMYPHNFLLSLIQGEKEVVYRGYKVSLELP